MNLRLKGEGGVVTCMPPDVPAKDEMKETIF